jgi:hypothetical protein
MLKIRTSVALYRARSADRAAFSLLEVIVCLAILVLALVPLSTMFSSSHRMGHIANRHIAVTLEAQALLEAFSQLELWEFPTLNPSGETCLMSDADGSIAQGSGRWSQVVRYVKGSRMESDQRRVTANKDETGAVVITVQVDWMSVEGDRRTSQSMCLRGLSAVRGWE